MAAGIIINPLANRAKDLLHEYMEETVRPQVPEAAAEAAAATEAFAQEHGIPHPDREDCEQCLETTSDACVTAADVAGAAAIDGAAALAIAAANEYC